MQPSHHSLSLGSKLALATSAVVGGIILAPYVLPSVGVGTEEMAENAIAALCSTGNATGLAGGVNSILEQVPLIGEDLAKGGWTNVATVAGVGIGGHLLGSALEKGETQEGFPWGKLVRYTALATSMLVALPSILTGVSTGLVYLAALAGGAELASTALTHAMDTLGTTGEQSSLATSGIGLSASAAHLLTCGMVMAPAALPWVLDQQKTKAPMQPDGAFHMEASTAQSIAPGVPNSLRITLRDAAGEPVTADQLATLHEKKLHVFVVDGSLGEYHHLHPLPAEKPGEYLTHFVPTSAGPYTVWAEAAAAGQSHPQVLRATLGAGLNAPARMDFRPNQQAAEQGLNFQWSASPPLRNGEESMVSLRVTDAQGQPAALQKLLGAQAHMTGFSADGQHFVHTHPMEQVNASSPLQFHLRPTHAGPTRFFVQVKRGGQEITAHFDQQIFPAKQQGLQLHSSGLAHQHAQPSALR